MTLDFSMTIVETGRSWSNAFKIVKENYFHLGILYSAKQWEALNKDISQTHLDKVLLK